MTYVTQLVSGCSEAPFMVPVAAPTPTPHPDTRKATP